MISATKEGKGHDCNDKSREEEEEEEFHERDRTTYIDGTTIEIKR